METKCCEGPASSLPQEVSAPHPDRWLQSPHTHSCAAYSLNPECVSAVQAQMCHQIITDTSSGFQARFRCFMLFYWPQRHILYSLSYKHGTGRSGVSHAMTTLSELKHTKFSNISPSYSNYNSTTKIITLRGKSSTWIYYRFHNDNTLPWESGLVTAAARVAAVMRVSSLAR